VALNKPKVWLGIKVDYRMDGELNTIFFHHYGGPFYIPCSALSSGSKWITLHYYLWWL